LINVEITYEICYILIRKYEEEEEEEYLSARSMRRIN